MAIAMARRQLNATWAADRDSALDAKAHAPSRAVVTEDLEEGAAAFVDKRTPRFVGR